jgi:dephospho-CoA kinase
MPKSLKIGITGGIGSGKSTVCALFAKLGVPIYDADSRARWLMENKPPLIEAIKNTFGKAVYSDENRLDRALLAKLVFEDAEKLKWLNSLVHPQVGIDTAEWFRATEGHLYRIKEAALLYESGLYKELDKIIVVSAPLEIRLQRTLKRDPHRSKEAVLAIIAKQMPETEKLHKADYVIVNDENQMLIPQVMDLHKKLSELAE